MRTVDRRAFSRGLLATATAVTLGVTNAISDRMHPGMLLITTELPASPDTRTGDDFVLMITDEA